MKKTIHITGFIFWEEPIEDLVSRGIKPRYGESSGYDIIHRDDAPATLTPDGVSSWVHQSNAYRSVEDGLARLPPIENGAWWNEDMIPED